MGADAFIAFYGIRSEIGDADAADAIYDRNDTRLASAKRAKLDTYIGRLTDGEPYFLFIGRRLGVFGVEGETSKAFPADDLARIAQQTDDAMISLGLGLPGEPQFWFQLEAQY